MSLISISRVIVDHTNLIWNVSKSHALIIVCVIVDCTSLIWSIYGTLLILYILRDMNRCMTKYENIGLLLFTIKWPYKGKKEGEHFIHDINKYSAHTKYWNSQDFFFAVSKYWNSQDFFRSFSYMWPLYKTSTSVGLAQACPNYAICLEILYMLRGVSLLVGYAIFSTSRNYSRSTMKLIINA